MIAAPVTPARTTPAPAVALPAVVVTAQRRETLLERTPVSASVVGGEAIREAGIEDAFDLQQQVPGFNFTSNSLLGTPTIRGVGSDLLSAGGDPSVATMVDDVYRSRATASLSHYYDVDRIEVLKGPQGTLYGRNAIGGALRVFSHAPDPHAFASSTLTLGNFDAARVEGVLNGPILGDAGRTRVSWLVNSRDGFSRNPMLDRGLDGEGVRAGRAQLVLLPGPATEIHLMADASRERSTRTLGHHPVPPLGGLPGAALGGTVSGDPRVRFSDLADFIRIDAHGVQARIRHEAPGVSVSSITAWRRSAYEAALDLDQTELDLISNRPRETARTFTQELQLASAGEGPWDWLAGVFYLHENVSRTLLVQAAGFGIRDVLSADVTVDALGVFARLSRRLSPHWRATIGARSAMSASVTTSWKRSTARWRLATTWPRTGTG